MSDAGEIRVKVTADPLGLPAQLALAKTQFATLSAEVRALSQQMATGGAAADAQLASKLNVAAAAAGNAKAKVAELTQEVNHFTPSVSTATRETRALFDELSSGRVRMVPGTLAIIAQRVLGISGAALAAAGIVGVLAGAFAYLEYTAVEAANAVSRIKLGEEFAGDLAATDEKIKFTVNLISDLPGVSRKSAEETVEAFQHLGFSGIDALEGLSAAATRYAMVFGGMPQEAAKKLGDILDQNKTSVEALTKTFPGLTGAEAQNFIGVQKLGNAHNTAAALITMVADRTKNAAQTWSSYESGIARVHSNLGMYMDALSGARPYEEAQGQVLASNTQLWNQQTDAIYADAKAMLSLPSDTSGQFAKDVDSSSRSTHGRMGELSDDIKRYQADLSNPSATDAQKANFRSMVADDQRELQTLGNKGKESFSKATGFKDVGAEAIANARETVSEIQANDQLGAQERIAQERQAWQNVLDTAKLSAAERIQVQRAMNESLAAANRAEAAEQRTIDRSNEDTSLELAKIAFQQKRDLLQQEVEAHQITKAQEYDQLVAIAQAEGALEQKAITDSEVGYAKDSANFIEAENKKKIAAARTEAEIAGLRAQGLAASISDARQDANAQIMGIDEVTSAERTFLGSYLSGRASLMASLEAATAQFIQKEIEDDAAYYTKKLLLSAQEFAAEKVQGGLLATWLTGQEAAKTAVTTAGAAQRVTAQSTADASAATAQATTNSAAAQSYAAVAATGAAAAVADVPLVGPELAPVAAATTYASLAPYIGLASLDVGAWNVPHDMTANIHAGETVVPKTFAQGLRDSGGAIAGGGQSVTNNHFHANFAPIVNGGADKSLGQMLEDEGGTFRSWIQSQMRSGALKFS